MLPAVLFPDVEALVTSALRARLRARPEVYAQQAYVSNAAPSPLRPYVVTVRRDGGPRLDAVREAARLGVNVWAPSTKDANDLANLVRALLPSLCEGTAVRRFTELSGPSSVPDSTPHLYLTAELVVVGQPL